MTGRNAVKKRINYLTKQTFTLMDNQNIELPFDALSKGYILLPKHMLETMLKDYNKPLTELEAMLTLLVSVNYKQSVCKIKGHTLVCERGESLYSIESWADMFRWDKCKAKRFLRKLATDKVIEFLPCPGNITTHLRVIDYNLWTGSRYEARQKKKEQEDLRFREFWDKYHATTRKPKTNRTRAEREWRKLTPQEQELAIEGIEHYFFDTVTDTRYCKQAATYLSDKIFLDDAE